jgi:phosphoserine phosphatase
MTERGARGAGSREMGYRTVVFDCDSTLVSVEGIDELAGPRIDQIRALTDLAMEGKIPLEEVYGRRLEVIAPTREQVRAIGDVYVRTVVPDAAEVIAALLWLEKDVRVISGGLLQPVVQVARHLGVAAERVAAVEIRFDADGGYAGFDRDSPLARSGGKAEVLRDWGVRRPSMLVGDGATDLEAAEAVDLFVAFMGVAFRPAVAAGADVVLRTPALAPVLALATSPEERDRLLRSSWAPLLRQGADLLPPLA